ncbi:MAG TPA: hypothetical protein P5142_00225 [Spirochaetia bacterium]|nr:hypothetical protein [Spirochaetia bacterium]
MDNNAQVIETTEARPRTDHYPAALEKILTVLDSGDPWDVAAAITVRTTYNEERRLRMRFERGANQLQETLERIREALLPAVVERILDKLGSGSMEIPPSGSEDRKRLVASLVDTLIGSFR